MVDQQEARQPVHDALSREDFNRWALRQEVPIFWVGDLDRDRAIDPDEVAALHFYPTEGHWAEDGAFTAGFERAYRRIVAAANAPALDVTTAEGKRRTAVGLELDAGRLTAVRTDVTPLSDTDREFVRHMLEVAARIDALYTTQRGIDDLADDLPDDPESHSLFRRNWGPACVAPRSQDEPACTAIPGGPKPFISVYPRELGTGTRRVSQHDVGFCAALDARTEPGLVDPFTVVRADGGELRAIPMSEAYPTQMSAIADELTEAAASLDPATEGPMIDYLEAAASAFTSNDWYAADEAWAKLDQDNTSWHVRVGPDEVYWDPCGHKGGFHLTFARMSKGSEIWKTRLAPLASRMESSIAELAGKPYRARPITFQLPDFMDIVINAGDARMPFGGYSGQSLPNTGPAPRRTIVLLNVGADPDQVAVRRARAETVLDAESLAAYPDGPDAALLVTILHEMSHNLGPTTAYQVRGKSHDKLFGGQLAQILEELKSETGAVFLIDLVRGEDQITDEEATQAYTYQVVWALIASAKDLVTADNYRDAYNNLAAIQIGFMIEQGALTWDPDQTAANGTDRGAFTIHHDKLVPAYAKLMKLVAGIKARGDVEAANALLTRYADGPLIPRDALRERFDRFTSFSMAYVIDGLD